MRALLVVVLVGAAISAVLLIKRQRGDDDAARPAVRVPAQLDTVRSQALTRVVRVPGALAAFETATITAQVGGVVRSVAKRPGDAVTAGEMVATLDTERLELAVRSADARTAQAEADLAEAQATLARSEKADQAQPGLISADEMARLRARVSRTVAAQAAAAADLAHAQLDLAQAAITAPFAGSIETRLIDTGAAVQPGTAIATVVRRDPVQVSFHLAAADAALLAPGHPVQVTVRDLPPTMATVRQVAAVADAGSRQVQVQAELIDAAPPFQPGLACTVSATIGSERTALVVPEAAVRVSERGELVFVAEERDGRIVARRREITAGVHLPGVVEATSGVSAGERVVVRGTDQVEDGVELDVPSGK